MTLCIITAILSAFLDNVTTMLLLTPVTLQLAKVLDLKPIPLLIAEVLFSNIGGTATMIGDLPNIIIGSQMSKAAIADSAYPQLAESGVSFNDFIIELAPGIIMTVIPAFMLLKWMYKDEFSGSRFRDVKELEAKYGIKDMKMLQFWYDFGTCRRRFLHPSNDTYSRFMDFFDRGCAHAYVHKSS